MSENISRDRLRAVLDDGADAQGRTDALNREAAEVREALRLARLQAEHSRMAVIGGDRRITKEIAPSALSRIATLEAQYERLDARRQQVWAEMAPRIELARRCYEHARANKFETGFYAF